jgi:transcription elongation factor Elf1
LRTRLKRIRKLIEAKESFHCPACMSENVVLDESQELGTFYECLTCNMSGWIDD